MGGTPIGGGTLPQKLTMEPVHKNQPTEVVKYNFNGNIYYKKIAEGKTIQINKDVTPPVPCNYV
jgi:hypothetical protein